MCVCIYFCCFNLWFVLSIRRGNHRSMWWSNPLGYVLNPLVPFLHILFVQGVHNTLSTAMQSVLALVGALSLQAGVGQDTEKLQERLQVRMKAIFGDELEQRLKEGVEQEDDQNRIQETRALPTEQKPMRVQYFVPKEFRPEQGDPWPCLHFRGGDLVKLEPTVSGRLDQDRLKWWINPKLPARIGLTFDTKTGE